MQLAAMGRYGLSQIELTHAGFNTFCSHRVLKRVKALMRGLYPILIEQTCKPNMLSNEKYMHVVIVNIYA